jgi:hypothetical protein
LRDFGAESGIRASGVGNGGDGGGGGGKRSEVGNESAGGCDVKVKSEVRLELRVVFRDWDEEVDALLKSAPNPLGMNRSEFSNSCIVEPQNCSSGMENSIGSD